MEGADNTRFFRRPWLAAMRNRLRLPGCRAIVSFPKSGRTQLRVMLDALGIDTSFTHAGSSDEHRRTATELSGAPTYWRRCKLLFMIRDPRDTVVSAYYHARYRSHRFDGDLATFLRNPAFGIEKIILFHLLWIEARPLFPRFSVLQYESLQRDPERELARVASFLTGRSFADRDIGRATQTGTFSNMRRLETGAEGRRRFGAALAPGDPLDPRSYKTRRGVIGGWLDEFSVADREFVGALLATHDYKRRLAAAGISAPLPAGSAPCLPSAG
jgi:hypothetical protein